MRIRHSTVKSFAEWQNKLSDSLIKENRYFNKKVEQIFYELFKDIEKISTETGFQIIKKIGPSTKINHLYRARCIPIGQNIDRIKEHPDIELGPAPAPGIGRLNSYYQPIFYGAKEIETACAEVRPDIASYIIYTKFNIIRELKILDFTVIQDILEYVFYNPHILKNNSNTLLILFNLGLLENYFSAPVHPENGPKDYIITQAVSDYLASFKIGKKLSLDGIAYKSVQNTEGSNIALFYKASRVKPINYHPVTRKIEIDEDVPDLQAIFKNQVWKLMKSSYTNKKFLKDVFNSLMKNQTNFVEVDGRDFSLITTQNDVGVKRIEKFIFTK